MNNIECASCSVTFSVTDHFESRRREDHANFYCPNGHVNYYPAPKVTPEQKKIGELEGAIERRSEKYRAVHDMLEFWKREARKCPICEERVTTAQFPETIRAKVAEHLRGEHGARQRLRAITAGREAEA